MTKFLKEWRSVILLGALIFVAAFILRVYHLTSLPIFGDEAIYIRWAQVMRAEPTLRFLPLSDGKQPLFMWSIIPLFKIFSDPLFAGRFLSVVSGIATLGGVFALSNLLFRSKKVALLTALIYALSPFSVFFDRLAMADAMLSAFGIWSLYFSVLTARTLRLDFAMITGFALGGGLLTKSPALFFAMLLPLSWALSAWPKGRLKVWTHLLKLIFLTLVSLGIGYGMYNILRLGPNFHIIALRNQDYVFPISHILENPNDPFIFHVKEIFRWLWVLGPSTLVLLIVGGVLTNIKKYPWQVLLLLAWAGIPLFAGAMYARVFTARYIIFSLPPLFVLAGSALLANRGLLKKIIAGGLLIFLLHSLYLNWLILTDVQRAPLPRSERSGYLEEWTSGYGIKEAADILRQKYNEQRRQIVVGTEGYFGTLPDGLQIYLNDLPEVKVFGVGVIIEDLPGQLIESKKAGNPTYFIINSTRYKGNAQEQGLRLIGSYPKGARPDGSREELYFFELTEASTKIPDEKDSL